MLSGGRKEKGPQEARKGHRRKGKDLNGCQMGEIKTTKGEDRTEKD